MELLLSGKIRNYNLFIHRNYVQKQNGKHYFVWFLYSTSLWMIHKLYGTTAQNKRKMFVSENWRLQKSMKYFNSTLIFFFPLVREKKLFQTRISWKLFDITTSARYTNVMLCNNSSLFFFYYRWLPRMVYLNLKPETVSVSIDIINIFVSSMHHVMRDCWDY